MRTLGDTLRKDFANERLVFAVIFDDRKAAAMYKGASTDSLNKSDAEFYDHHILGSYTRNPGSGNHKYAITLEGLNGKQIDVDYSKQ
jgi:hypothetical protein